MPQKEGGSQYKAPVPWQVKLIGQSALVAQVRFGMHTPWLAVGAIMQKNGVSVHEGSSGSGLLLKQQSGMVVAQILKSGWLPMWIWISVLASSYTGGLLKKLGQ